MGWSSHSFSATTTSLFLTKNPPSNFAIPTTILIVHFVGWAFQKAMGHGSKLRNLLVNLMPLLQMFLNPLLKCMNIKAQHHQFLLQTLMMLHLTYTHLLLLHKLQYQLSIWLFFPLPFSMPLHQNWMSFRNKILNFKPKSLSSRLPIPLNLKN